MPRLKDVSRAIVGRERDGSSLSHARARRVAAAIVGPPASAIVGTFELQFQRTNSKATEKQHAHHDPLHHDKALPPGCDRSKGRSAAAHGA